MANPASHSRELKLLNRFAGAWNTIGTLYQGNEKTVFSGTDSYEWLAGGFFLIHQVDVMMGESRQQTLEVIGYDTLSGSYPMHFYDNQGESGISHGYFEDDKWSILSPELRFEGSFSDNDQILSGKWEQFDGQRWTLLMDIRLQKQL